MSYQIKKNSIIVLNYIESKGIYKNKEVVCFVSSEFPIDEMQNSIDRKSIFAREATKLEKQLCYEFMESHDSKDYIGCELSCFDKWLAYKNKQ